MFLFNLAVGNNLEQIAGKMFLWHIRYQIACLGILITITTITIITTITTIITTINTFVCCKRLTLFHNITIHFFQSTAEPKPHNGSFVLPWQPVVGFWATSLDFGNLIEP